MSPDSRLKSCAENQERGNISGIGTKGVFMYSLEKLCRIHEYPPRNRLRDIFKKFAKKGKIYGCRKAAKKERSFVAPGVTGAIWLIKEKLPRVSIVWRQRPLDETIEHAVISGAKNETRQTREDV